MDKKTSIKIFKPEYLAEYTINNQLRQVILPVSSLDEMKNLWKLIRQEKMDLELEDQIIKWSWLIRFFQNKPANEFDYFVSRIPDEEIRERFIVLRKQRRSEGRSASLRILWSMYQRIHLNRKDDEKEECDDADGIIKLLEPYLWQ